MKKPSHINTHTKKWLLKLGIQTCQILTNDDEVCIPSLSNILLVVLENQTFFLLCKREKKSNQFQFLIFDFKSILNRFRFMHFREISRAFFSRKSSCKISKCGYLSVLVDFSRVFLLRQLWTVNYYVKSSSNNLSNENIKTGVSREIIFQNSSFWHFNSRFVLKTTEAPVFMFSLLRLSD